MQSQYRDIIVLAIDIETSNQTLNQREKGEGGGMWSGLILDGIIMVLK